MKTNVRLHMLPTAAELPVSSLFDLGLASRPALQGPQTPLCGRSPAATDALWQLALGNLVARKQASPFSVYAALSGDSAESGGWDAAARVAREGPLMTPLQPALQECLECRVAMLRPSTPATPPRSESQRGPLFGMRLEELVMADLQRAGLCAAAAAHSACSVRRGAKRARLSSPPAPAAWPALPVALTAGSGAWAGAEAEADLDESELDEAVTCSAGSDSCGSDASDAELEDDAQSTSPTFSFQAWPAPGPGRAGSAESVSGGLSCGRSAPRA